ncbi:aspartate/glutamate racemase family protein [Pigmentiphaga soli]|uniref:Aspartate/glutamate racemase family protein n=1 Tax=Pigmentiphaga soli TaxID=1007095 RepID=A0ABP8GEJ7_9BURK
MKHSDLRRFGVIGPAGNMALEYEFSRHLPPGVAFNHARASRPGWPALTRESLAAMGERAIEAARDLVRTRPEILLYACTSGSFVGQEHDEAALARRIAEATGIPAITTSTAVLDALKALSARKVFVVTPYPDDITLSEVEFLELNGIGVAGWDSFRCTAERPIGGVDSDDTERLVLGHRDAIAGADAVFVSCTNLLTFDKIAALESALGVPVVSSNTASLWAVLRGMGIGHASPALGVLGARG